MYAYKKIDITYDWRYFRTLAIGTFHSNGVMVVDYVIANISKSEMSL